MNRRPATLNKLSIFCLLTCFCSVWLGTTCAGGGGNEPPLNPDVPSGNRPPRATITSVITPSNDNFAEQGELITINYTADDGEDQITLRIFASRKQTNVTTADEIPIASGIFLGPTQGSGSVVWNTAGVAVGTYYIFCEVNDGVNAPVRVTAASSIQIAPPGSRPQNAPPQLTFFLPISNLGLSSQDEVVVQYGYSDPDDSVTITLLLDKDQDPSNDDISNPGDPLDPNSKIIILPSTARKPNDPVFDGDVPGQTPTQRDSLEIRTNPRTLDKTAPGQADGKEYRFTIDFSQIPVRNEPYYLRGTIKDAKSTIHRYAQGSITITSLASGVVDMAKVGFGIAGARWTGFGTGENLGSTFIANFDLDTDTNGDFVIGSRFASPRNRFQSGAAYLIFGRRKAPFPPDVDNDGRPGGNVIDSNTGATDNFPAPPAFVSNPYNAAFVGRFGGAQNINSVSSLYRGTTIGMPEPHTNNLPPVDLRDPDHPNRPTSGLTSIARIDMSADGVPDFVFGVPFVSSAYDYHDDDPVDGGCDLPYNDGLPNGPLCDTGGGLGRGSPNDDITSARFKNPNEDIDQGIVIALDGTNNINTTFRLFLDAAMAGQNDPAGPIDDEGVNIFATVPNGMRFRGGWLASTPPGDTSIPIVSDNQYGRTVAGIPSIDNDGRDELLISVPGFQANRGMIEVWLSNNYINGGFYGQPVRSLPSYLPIGCSQGGTPTSCIRTLATLPVHVKLLGAAGGDEFGYASSGGHFNQDGTADILAGAPGADTQAIINGSPSGPFLTDNGIFYVLFTPSGGFGNTDLGTENPPRVEIRGTHNGDRFGMVQSEVADMNGDGLTDVAFASENMDDDIRGNANAGFVGVIFGFRPLTGENGFSPEQVGTPQLPGVRFFGATSGAHAGRSISTAGEFNVPTLVNGVPRLPRDFNNDGYGDLLISSPGEIRNVNIGDTNGDGIDEIQARTGVAYLIFGGPHLINKTFNLSQVGSPDLPGIVFISRFVTGSQDEAPLETVSGLGDIDGDGFVDVIVGCPKADFVDPLSPNQRRNQAGEVYIIYGNNFGSNRLP